MAAKTVKDAFGDKTLYEVLEVDKGATGSQIKRAYYKLARKVHPDRNPAPEATILFQALGVAYETLSNDEKRKVYDDTGVIEDEDGLSEEGREWYDKWRAAFPRVTIEAVKEFEAKYRFSKEEQDDVLLYFVAYDGNIEKVMENVMLSTAEDKPRFVQICFDAIDADEVEGFASFLNQFGRTKKARVASLRKLRKQAQARGAKTGEEDEAAEAAAALGLQGGDGSLTALIRGRTANRQGSFEDLLGKYIGGGAGSDKQPSAGRKRKGSQKGRPKAKRMPQDPLSDADFERIQQEMLRKKSNARK